jgi:hypothetical protein
LSSVCEYFSSAPDDHRSADDFFRAHVVEHEDVLALFRVLHVAGEALLRQVDDLADRVAVVGEVHRVEVAGD